MANSELPKVGELLDFLNKGIPSYLRAARDEREQVITQLKVQQHESEEQRRQITELTEENKYLRKNLDDTKLRLSRYMGMQMTNNNPNIADLSDENRPTKIAEMYNELYDNTWTDAYDCLVKLGRDERSVIDMLRKILMTTRMYCDGIGDPLLANLRSALFMEEGESVPDFVLKIFKDNRRKNVDQCLLNEYEKYLSHVESGSSELGIIARRRVPEYTKECFKICYLMSIQDPPVVFETTPAESMDPSRYRLFTVKGDKIDYIVWPCVLLNEGGAVLSKGVVQCIELEARSSSVPPRSETNDQSTEVSRHVVRPGNVRQAWEETPQTTTARETGDGATVKVDDAGVYQNSPLRKEIGTAQTSDIMSPDQAIQDQVDGGRTNQPVSNYQQTVARSPGTDSQHQNRLSASLKANTPNQRAEDQGNPGRINTMTSTIPLWERIDSFRWYLTTYGEERTRQRYRANFETLKYYSDNWFDL